MSLTPDVLTDEEELQLLRDLAARVPDDQCVVELGVFRGGSLAALSEASTAPVFGIDTFGGEGTPEYYQQGSGWIEWWERKAGRGHDWGDNHRAAEAAAPDADIIVADTAETGRYWEGPAVGLLYIDADHSYEGVRADWEAWRDQLGPHAVVVFDDYMHIVRGRDHYPDVTRLVDEAAAQLGLPIERVGKAAVVRLP